MITNKLHYRSNKLITKLICIQIGTHALRNVCRYHIMLFHIIGYADTT